MLLPAALLQELIREQHDTNLLLRSLLGALSRQGLAVEMPRATPPAPRSKHLPINQPPRDLKSRPYTDKDITVISRSAIEQQQETARRASLPHNHPLAEQPLGIGID